MKKLTIIIAILLAGMSTLSAQEKNDSIPKQFMQVTTIESVVAGGMGRSKMLITKPDGSQEERDLNNLFSIGGINFKNIKENENTIVRFLKQYTDEGWKLEQIIPLTLSPGDGGGGIFMTRYLLSKQEVKKGF